MSLTPVAGAVFRTPQQMIQSVIGRPHGAAPTIPQLYTLSTGPNLSDDICLTTVKSQDFREDYTRTKVVCD